MAPQDDTVFTPELMAAFKAGQNVIVQGFERLKQVWDKLCNDVNSLLRAAQHLLNTDSAWASFYEWCTDTIKDAIKKIRELFQKIKTSMDKYIDLLTRTTKDGFPVVSLLEAGMAYTETVLPNVSSLSTDMVGSGKIDSWDAPAHDTYKARCVDQQDAVENCTERVKDVSGWLDDVAKGNVEFMTKTGDKLSEILDRLVRVAIDGGETVAGAVTQAPLALKDFSDVIGGLVAAAMQYEMDLANHLTDAIGKMNELEISTKDDKGLKQNPTATGVTYDWPHSVEA